MAAGPVLVCPACATAWDGDLRTYRCPACSGPFSLASAPLDPVASRAGAGPWRYAAWIPVPPVSLGEPTTPLVDLPWRGATATLKLEGALPTGSFKDRGAAVLASWLCEQGVREVVEDSSGNAGAALAAYCARAGIACTLFVPEHASPGKLTQGRAHGARVVRVPGPRPNATTALLERLAAGDAVYATHLWNPLYQAGTRTFAFELWEQLDGRAPDAILVPTGAGGLLLGASLGFAALAEAGLVERVPRLYAVQSEACAPLVRALAAGAARPEELDGGPSIAEGMLISRPPRGVEALAAIRASGGGGVAVSDEAIWAAADHLAASGVLAEPTSAAAWAALDLLAERGDVQPGERVVLAITGHGLKTEAAIRAHLDERAG